MDDVKYPERVVRHFSAVDGTRMEASYIRYPRPNGQWAYYKLPRSERKCECRWKGDTIRVKPGLDNVSGNPEAG